MSKPMETVEDHRIDSDICGVKEIGPSGIEWICIDQPHAEIYRRKSSDRTHQRGDLLFSDNPRAFSHFFVNRWPNREKE